MKPDRHRFTRLRNDLTNEHEFEPKLADGISNAVCETVLLVYEGIEAAEARLADKFEKLERELRDWHYDDQRQLREHLTQLRTIETDIHKKITRDFMHSDEIWWRTIVAALSGSAVSIVLFSIILALIKS